MNEDSSIHLQNQIRQAVAGDRDALGLALTRYRSYLKVLASAQIHQRLREKADPSDLVQETFLEAHKQIETFRGSSNAEFAGWLRGILAHLLARHVRRYLGTHQRDIRMERSLALELDQASGAFAASLVAKTNSPSEILMETESVLELATAMEQLPEDYRMAIVLRNIQGLPFAEVAMQMNRSVDSVEKLWVRGLAKLKGLMDQGSSHE
jgi:RNA polymerase sigma-70 factor, ECF subfamily